MKFGEFKELGFPTSMEMEDALAHALFAKQIDISEVLTAYTKALEAEKDLGWISVKDRLPEVGHFVLTCVDDSGTPQSVGMALLLKDGTWWDGDMKVCVDYWMEVPKLKK